jgi:ribosomal protein S18 acetylase RimI-like enzyme
MSPAVSPDTPSIQHSDALLLVETGGIPTARAALYWRSVPQIPGERVGLIGHYAASDDDAAEVLSAAKAELARRGATLLVGPMDGSTFRGYRFVTQRSFDGVTRPRFFTEPDNPDAWPAHFIAAGFVPYAHYVSAVGALPETDTWPAKLADPVAAARISLRPARLDAFEEEVDNLYELVMRSFRQNLLFAPIARSEFVAQFAPLRAILAPGLVWIAERPHTDGVEPVGFVLCFPDAAQAQRGEPIDTIVVKTLAVLPEVGGLGLGGLLTAQAQNSARALGFRYAIHALMHEGNVSRKISSRYAALMRRYTLFVAR